MKQQVYKILRAIGIDKAILFTSLARILQGFGGVISVLFVARYLTGVEQGFYYTFASLLAIQMFFELGLNGIVTQYVAHEAVHLEQDGNKYKGSEKHLSRMASLLHFCVKWYAILAFALLTILIIVGYIFFNHFYQAETPIVWQLPWVLLTISTTIYFTISPFIAFIEGLGKVKEIAKIRLIQQIIVMLITWSGLFAGLKLYVSGIAQLAGVIILIYFIGKQFFPLLNNIYKQTIADRVSYRNEIFPFQWKIALSWISGYFIFQLFNPVLFATEGAIVAGQMGMTLSALNAVLSFSLSWTTTKIPTFSAFIAQKNYSALDKLFNRTLLQSTAINFSGLIVMFISIFLIRHFHIEIGSKNLGDRFLPYLPMILMMTTILMNHIVNALATYLRCHKREPMMIQSIVIGILCSISTLFLGKHYGVMGITAGYTVITVIGSIWAGFIFVTNKRNWHNE